jgi:type II secretory pathway component GspD/PulD (secretin)
VTTFNNLTAQIRAVTNIPVVFTDTDTQVTNGVISRSVTQTVTFFPTGAVLTVTPTINQDGTITITMQPAVAGTTGRTVDFGSVDEGTAGTIPIIGGQQIDTISNVKDGETLAIGGLRLKSNTQSTGRIPILGSLPLIGRLFRSTRNQESEEELIIFVTARIVRRIDDPVSGT